MNYLIAVVEDRIKAEEAYTALEKSGIATSQLSILGKGYKSADEFGFLDSSAQTKKGALRMAVWLVPFGFGGGYIFDLITGLDTFMWAGDPGNHIIGGLCGAIGGAMGSFFVGGGVAFSSGNGEASFYRNLLKINKYLVVVDANDILIQDKATYILQRFNPESLQGYQK